MISSQLLGIEYTSFGMKQRVYFWITGEVDRRL
jgi:hypothetical protein